MTPKTREQRADDNDIAVVGMSCRLPGAATVGEFWHLLRDGRDAVTRQADGTWRGALPEHGEFDADFFGISPREAAAMDPQQRLALELAWEALEDAGIVPAALGGTRTGVFVGVTADDYAALHPSRRPPRPATPPPASTAACRQPLSYLLGLRGPSLAVDTASRRRWSPCTWPARACAAARATLALAGGVNLILAPDSTVADGAVRRALPGRPLPHLRRPRQRLRPRRGRRRRRAQAAAPAPWPTATACTA